DGLTVGDRRIVDRRDSDINADDVTVGLPVIDLEGETVQPVVIGRRGVSEVRRGAAQAAVQWRADDNPGERGVFNVRGHERIVDRRDAYAHCRDVAVPGAVIDLEGEAVRAVVIEGRGVSEVRRGAA